MAETLRIGIAGLGTVGAGTLKILFNHASLMAERAGVSLEVVAVSARSKGKDRGVDLSGVRFEDDPVAIARDETIDLVVELIGGADGVAKALVETALKNGKSVVTANKALIADHGMALSKLAETHGAVLAYEAAVAGGIPIVKALRDGMAANVVSQIVGILNGTGNYILTTMDKQGRDFDDVLKEAQDLGYAEADPSFDIDGIDTAHKLAILASLGFGTALNFEAVYTEGIRRISSIDMHYARQLGYAIKLLGIATHTNEGVMMRVHPAMVPLGSAIGRVDGAFNAVVLDGDAVGTVTLEGQGAGAGPTASAVVADIIDIARGARYIPFVVPVERLKTAVPLSIDMLRSSYYIRLAVIDKPGVLAEVTSILRDEKISMRSCLQHSHQPGEAVQVVMVTHQVGEDAMARALMAIEELGSVVEPVHRIRIEKV